MKKRRTTVLLYRGQDERYDPDGWYYQIPDNCLNDWPNYGSHVRFVGAAPEYLLDKFTKEMKHYRRRFPNCNLERELQITFTEFCLRQGYYQKWW